MTTGQAEPVAWLVRRPADVPDGDAWLAPEEAATLARLRVPKRREEWRLGRWTAKVAVAGVAGCSPAEIAVAAGEDGAPTVSVAGRPGRFAISIAHRAELAMCAVADPSLAVGCDLELVEPRSPQFVEDYLTPAERALVAETGSNLRDALVAGMWTAKESVLKALHVGLRWDTRSVEVVPRGGPGPRWTRFAVRGPAPVAEHGGWWRLGGSHVLAIATRPPTGTPRELLALLEGA
jgi:4'-phosphopantetheinyl transferase